MPRPTRLFRRASACLLFVVPLLAAAQPAPASVVISGPENRARELERPLRYSPDGPDFVIENGGEFFNRPLYGTNTAFRVDGGDLPEWSLYLPGRGGNLRLGVVSADGSVRWLHQASRVIARYRPGALRHEIFDPTLGAGEIVVDSVPAADREGLIVRVSARGLPASLTLGWAYGGANGQRGRRDGDIGTERVPIGEYFQFSPANAKDQSFALAPDGSFLLKAPRASLRGLTHPASRLAVVPAETWDAPFAAPAPAAAPALPVLAGRITLTARQPAYLWIERDDAGSPPPRPSELPARYEAAEAKRLRIQNQVTTSTPDPHLDAAVGALNLAADAVWDEKDGAVMHGAVAWRSKLLGWRGPYANDALGWHDRARRHFDYWAGQQKTGEIPAVLPPPEEATHLSRSRAALHSPGAMSFNHYDMNLVYIDALFRHLMWTGDLDHARAVWPVIERHLAWERRLFRREFATGSGEKLPLYEAYACIWASDDIQYHGGGVAYSSAYNHWHNLMAARLARLLGQDPAPYQTEADLIARAMREHLWMPDRGAFAEFKDLLGLQLVHPAAGLWSVYHVLDSEVVTPAEAWSLTRYVEREIPRLPVRGPGVPEGLSMFSTSNWMPYSWSVNNVVMGENLHTALAFWQAGRPDAAYELARASLVASLFMGVCPGNIGSMNYLDAYRGESQRDFADGSGVFARALVEGLFGLQPDLLAGELRFSPGFPAAWDRASLRHPGADVSFTRSGKTDTYRVVSRLARPAALRLTLPRRFAEAAVSVNGVPVAAAPLTGATEAPRLVAAAPAAREFEIVVRWSGAPVSPAAAPAFAPAPPADIAAFVAPPAPAADARLEPVALAPVFNDRVTAIFAPGKYRSPRSPHVSLALPAQGIGAWAGHVNATAEIDDSGLRAASAANGGRFALPSGVAFATPGPGDAPNVAFVSQWDNYPRELSVPLSGRARRVHLLMAGSTNWMQSRLDNGEVVATYADGSVARLPLHNPTTWWPIDQDYFIDGLAFHRPEPVPLRVDLKTARVRAGSPADYHRLKAVVPGGSATVLALPLDPAKELRSLTVRALANEVVVGLLAATLER